MIEKFKRNSENNYIIWNKKELAFINIYKVTLKDESYWQGINLTDHFIFKGSLKEVLNNFFKDEEVCLDIAYKIFDDNNIGYIPNIDVMLGGQ